MLFSTLHKTYIFLKNWNICKRNISIKLWIIDYWWQNKIIINLFRFQIFDLCNQVEYHRFWITDRCPNRFTSVISSCQSLHISIYSEHFKYLINDQNNNGWLISVSTWQFSVVVSILGVHFSLCFFNKHLIIFSV